MDNLTQQMKIASIVLIVMGIFITKIMGAKKQQMLWGSIFSTGYLIILSTI